MIAKIYGKFEVPQKTGYVFTMERNAQNLARIKMNMQTQINMQTQERMQTQMNMQT